MNTELITDFLDKTGKEVVVDANVFILLLVGLTNKNYIKKVKSTKIFTANDYLTLQNLLKKFEKIITTPNILTEVSNLSGQKEKFRKDLFTNFNKLVGSSYLKEEFVDSAEASEDKAFKRLGLTDSVIIKLIENQSGVITKDLILYLELENRGLTVLNFNYLMEMK